jgi:hypothetical protein
VNICPRIASAKDSKVPEIFSSATSSGQVSCVTGVNIAEVSFLFTSQGGIAGLANWRGGLPQVRGQVQQRDSGNCSWNRWDSQLNVRG